MHEYQKRLLLAIKKGAFSAPNVYQTFVEHDDWCAYNKGNECNCNPRITITSGKGKSANIDENGEVISIATN